MSDPTLLPFPELQFIDANGIPYEGGTLELYEPGTSTFKASWMDSQGTMLNTNPIVLNSAGRCIVWGDGDYRCVLRDINGNLIYDQESTTLVSAAMVPVVSAPTIAEAVRLLGIGDMVQAETDRAEAAEGALRTDLNAEVARATAAETSLRTDLNAEIARAEAAETALGSRIDTVQTCQGGLGNTSSTGHGRVTFPHAFHAGSEPYVVAVQKGITFDLLSATINADATGFDIWLAFPLTSGITPAGARPFYWLALGTPA